MILSILAAAAVQASPCDKFAADYDYASKRMGLIMAEGIGDDSAVRATMREAQENNIRQEARDTLELMKAHKCKNLPISVPSVKTYGMQAMKCGTDMRIAKLKGQFPTFLDIPSCDVSKWTREN